MLFCHAIKIQVLDLRYSPEVKRKGLPASRFGQGGRMREGPIVAPRVPSADCQPGDDDGSLSSLRRRPPPKEQQPKQPTTQGARLHEVPRRPFSPPCRDWRPFLPPRMERNRGNRAIRAISFGGRRAAGGRRLEDRRNNRIRRRDSTSNGRPTSV